MTPAPARPQSSRITVIDADTVEQAGARWRIDGIDAPEVQRASCPLGRQLGIVAAARLIELLKAKGGRLIETRKRPDKYGRKVGRLMLGWPSQGEEEWADLAIREGHAVAHDGRARRHDWCGGTA